MEKMLSRFVIAVMCFIGLGCVADGQQPKSQANVNPDAQLLQDFQTRIAKYMDLHNRLERESPPLKEATDPATIEASQSVLAEKIRVARGNARAGDIFTPGICSLFRRLMYPELRGADGAEAKATIQQDAPAAGSRAVQSQHKVS